MSRLPVAPQQHIEQMHLRIGTVLVLISCLGTALAISGREEESSGDVVGAVVKDHPSASSKQEADAAGSRFDLHTLKRRIPKATRNSAMFESKSWYVPPVMPVQQTVNLPPPPPSAPPMPFTFTGRMIDGSEVTLFLGRNGQQYTVKKGDVVEETYRIEEIGMNEAAITHLPTNTRQTLPLGSTAVGSKSLDATAGIPAVTELRPLPQLVPNIEE